MALVCLTVRRATEKERFKPPCNAGQTPHSVTLPGTLSHSWRSPMASALANSFPGLRSLAQAAFAESHRLLLLPVCRHFRLLLGFPDLPGH